MLIAQITDLHVFEPGTNYLDGIDTEACLAAAIDRLEAFTPRPDIVLVTGDLTDFGTAAAYQTVRPHLDRLTQPVYVIPGNHDSRAPMRAAFADHAYLPRTGTFLHYTADLGPLHLIALDTVRPGESGGELCGERLDWLRDRLREARGQPVLIAMHHPPFDTGIPFMDRIGLDGREHFVQLVADHGRVERIVCGHVHRPISVCLAETVASSCPSTAHQIPLTFDPANPGSWNTEPPALQLHLWHNDRLVTHTLPIQTPELPDAQFDGE